MGPESWKVSYYRSINGRRHRCTDWCANEKDAHKRAAKVRAEGCEIIRIRNAAISITKDN